MLLQPSYHNKPKVYQNQATVETVNAGIPYYVASPEFGYEGVHVPIAGSVSEMSTINPHTGELQLKDWNSPDKLWVTCTKSRYQYDRLFTRCSLSDDGVIYQTYSSRLAFLDPFSAKYYAETGKVKTKG